MSQAAFLIPASGPGSGTVTSISASTGITLTPNPITTTGTVALTIPVTVPDGGTAQTTLLNHGVLLGAGTSGVNSAAVGVNGSLLIGASSADPAFALPTSTGGSLTYTTGANSLNIDIANYADKVSWTPVLTFGAASVGMSYSVQTGSYIRLGNMVMYTMQISLSAKGSSTGNCNISGLPFTPILTGSSSFYWSNMTYTGSIQAFVASGTTNIGIQMVNSGGTAATLTNTGFSDSSVLIITGVYGV